MSQIPINSGQNQSKTQEKDQASEFRVVDKRHFTALDTIAATAAVEEKPRYPTFVEELMTRLSEMERRFEEKKKQVDEEIAKMRGRLEADYERRVELEKRKFILPFLEVLDNLERAVEVAQKRGSTESLLEGVAMTASLFRSKLLAHGIEAIPVLEQPFDPNFGQAVGIVPVTDESRDGIVVEEVQHGYRMGDQLLRPVQVRVGKFQD